MGRPSSRGSSSRRPSSKASARSGDLKQAASAPAAAPKKRKRKKTAVGKRRAEIRREGLREWVDAAMKAGVIALVLFFFLWPVRVSGESMTAAYRDGDRVLMSRCLAYFKLIKRGDVVICAANAQMSDKNIIKRVIGLPGDRVTITGGDVLLNGSLIDEPYINTRTGGEVDMLLDDDEYFVMGDNRPDSRDSRTFGPVKKAFVAGKVLWRYYPFRSR